MNQADGFQKNFTGHPEQKSGLTVHFCCSIPTHEGKIHSVYMICILLIMNLTTCNGQIRAHSYETGYTTLRFTDKERGNRTIRVAVYYPSRISGRNAPLPDSTDGKFPVICFGHGYRLPADIYGNICKALVPEGFIVAFPLTERGMFPSHASLGQDIAFVAKQLKKEGASETSVFYGRIGEKCCYMGHSMGGGAAVLGTSYGSGPDAIALLAPFETKPSAVKAAGNIDFPILIFAGGNDCITPPEQNQLPIYEAVKSADKTYITIIGGSHCQMAHDHYLCRLAEATCRPKPAVSREEQHALIERYLVPWLKSRLKGEKMEGEKLDGSLVKDRSVTWSLTRK